MHCRRPALTVPAAQPPATRLLATKLPAIRQLATKLLAIRLLATKLLAIRLLATKLLATRLLAILLPVAVVACGGPQVERSDRDRGLTDVPIRGELDTEPLRGALLDGVRAYGEGDWDAAETALRKHLESQPKSALAHYHLGLVAMERGQFDPARQSFEAALELNPQLHGAASNLGALYLQAGENVAALKALRLAQSIAPDDVRVLVNLAAVLLRRGLWSEAIEAYQKAHELAPGHGTLMYDYALALMDRQEHGQACKLLDEVLQLRPKFALAHAARVACLQGQGLLTEAETAAHASLDELSPPLPDNHVVLARVLVAQRKVAEAREELEKALDLDPKSAAAQLALGELMDATGQKPRAAELYGQYLKNPERHPDEARRIRDRLKQIQGAR